MPDSDIHEKHTHFLSPKSPEVASGWLEAIIESAEDAVISKTLEGVIASWNKGAERIFGYSAEEIIGKPVIALFPPDRIPEELEILARIGRGERIQHFETIRRRKDGVDIPVSLTISPIKSVDGKIIGASKIVRDITERRIAEAKLKEEAEVVERINEIGRLLSAQLDMDKLVQSVTDAATTLTGAELGLFFYDVRKSDGDSFVSYKFSGVPEVVAKCYVPDDACSTANPLFGEVSVRIDDITKDLRFEEKSPFGDLPIGQLPSISYLSVPVKSIAGEVIGGLLFGHSRAGAFTQRHEKIVEGLASQAAIAMDNARLYQAAQTAIKEKEALLVSEQTSRLKAEEAGRAKDEFLGLLSHELRTPLNSILGWAQMLSSHQLDAEALDRAIETISRNAKLQAKLIDDMLDLSRIISGRLRLDAQAVDLSFVINAAIDTVRPAAEAKEIRLTVALDYGSGVVLGDPTRLQQVVWNLLSNAIKFTPKSGSVQVALAKVNSHFELTISDTGPGIAEDFLPYVFDRFRQADSSTQKKFGGLGLGLAIVRQLTEMHGGTVHVANRVDGPGAIFTVELPVLVTRKQLEQLSTDGGHVDQRAYKLDRSSQLEGIRVLAVDDEPDSRFLLTTVLEQASAQVKAVGSVPEALAALDEFKPHVLVSDIGMPEEDGYSLIAKLRQKELGTGKRLPAIALTAFARIEDRIKALSAGYSTHIPKPVEPAELILVIASLTAN